MYSHSSHTTQNHKSVKVNIEKLKAATKERGTRSAIADALGMTPSSVYAKVSGYRPMTINQLNLVAKCIGADTADFLLVESPSDPDQPLLPFYDAPDEQLSLMKDRLDRFEDILGGIRKKLDEIIVVHTGESAITLSRLGLNNA